MALSRVAARCAGVPRAVGGWPQPPLLVSRRGHPSVLRAACTPSRAAAPAAGAAHGAWGRIAAASAAAAALLLADPGSHCDGGGADAAVPPPFDLTKPYYDEATYEGRVRNVLDKIDTRLLLVTDAELQRCQRLLEEFKSGKRAKDVTDADLWQARRVVEGIIHPVTGEKMFIVGRMSAFVLVNMPVAAGMLIHGPTSTWAAVFWQMVNQSNNVICNYVNRSGANVDWNGLLQSYGLALSVSCGLALAAGKIMERNPRLKRFGIIVPYFAVISASSANMFFSRMKEWTDGVPVFDHEGVERGLSAAAGLEGVVRTVSTRSVIIPMPLLFFPPLLMQALRTVPAVAARLALLTAAELSIIAVCLQGALPLVLAMQPARMELQAVALEPRFHGLRDSKGVEVHVLYANKGL